MYVDFWMGVCRSCKTSTLRQLFLFSLHCISGRRGHLIYLAWQKGLLCSPKCALYISFGYMLACSHYTMFKANDRNFQSKTLHTYFFPIFLKKNNVSHYFALEKLETLFPILLARVIVNDNVIGTKIEKNLSQRLGIVLHVPVEM